MVANIRNPVVEALAVAFGEMGEDVSACPIKFYLLLALDEVLFEEGRRFFFENVVDDALELFLSVVEDLELLANWELRDRSRSWRDAFGRP